MIGEMIGELTGKVVGQRIIRHHHTTDVKLERTQEMKGKILGTDVSFIATYTLRERPQGGMYAEGNGVIMTMKGEKVIGTWIRCQRRDERYGLDHAWHSLCPDNIPGTQQAQQCCPGLRDGGYAGWNIS